MGSSIYFPFQFPKIRILSYFCNYFGSKDTHVRNHSIYKGGGNLDRRRSGLAQIVTVSAATWPPFSEVSGLTVKAFVRLLHRGDPLRIGYFFIFSIINIIICQHDILLEICGNMRWSSEAMEFVQISV